MFLTGIPTQVLITILIAYLFFQFSMEIQMDNSPLMAPYLTKFIPKRLTYFIFSSYQYACYIDMLCKFSLSLLLIIPSLLSCSLIWLIENEYSTSHISLFQDNLYIIDRTLTLFELIEGVLLDERSNNAPLLTFVTSSTLRPAKRTLPWR